MSQVTHVIVPSVATRKLARRMISTATKTTGADAALLLRDCHPDQVAALIGLLLTAVKIGGIHDGRPRLPDRFTPEQRREGNRLYKQGDRREWVIEAKREYQRHYMRRHRQSPGYRRPAREAG
jgi:hypothetical protein